MKKGGRERRKKGREEGRVSIAIVSQRKRCMEYKDFNFMPSKAPNSQYILLRGTDSQSLCHP